MSYFTTPARDLQSLVLDLNELPQSVLIDDPLAVHTDGSRQLTSLWDAGAPPIQAFLRDKGGQVYNVQALGAVPDGVTNNTAVYNAIFASAPSGILYFPPGVFVGTILYPNTPADLSANWHVVGSGVGVTFLMPAAANTPVIKKAVRAANTIVERAELGGFSIRAHAAGSTGVAVDLAGFRSCRLHHWNMLSNGTGNFVNGVHLSSGEMLCYDNEIDHWEVDEQTGPTGNIILFDNKNDAGVPQGALFNSNIASIHHFKVYANTGISTGIDCLRSGAVSIHHGTFEANGAGFTTIKPGTKTSIDYDYFEANATTDEIKFESVIGQGTSNGVGINDCYFATLAVENIPTDVVAVAFIDCSFASVGYPLIPTFNDPGLNCLVMTGGNVDHGVLQTKHLGSRGAAPAVSSTGLGAGGTATLQAGSTDTAGLITLTFGAAASATGTVTLTFAESYLNPPIPQASLVASTLNVWSAPLVATQCPQIAEIAVSSFKIFWANSGVPSNGNILQLSYHVDGIPN